MKRNRNVTALVLVLLGATSYGFVTPVFKMAAIDGWDVRSLTFLQVLCGAVVLWLILLIRGGFRPLLKLSLRVWFQLILTGVCGMALTTLLYNRTLMRLDASLSIVLLFQYAWITILLESIRSRRWPLRREWRALILIIIGTVPAVGLLERDPGDWDTTGLLLGLSSAVSYGLFFFLAGFLPKALEPFAKSAVMAAASLMFITLTLGTGTLGGTGNVPLWVWGLLLGILGTALPMLCFNAGIPKMGASLAALLGSLELPVAILAAYLMLGEPLTGWQVAGVMLILAGIMAAQSRRGGAADVRPGSEE